VGLASDMKFDERLKKISEKSQGRKDMVMITLGLGLLVVACFSYFTLEAFGQEDLVKLDCPKDAYHGLDDQGNNACRDIQTNKILEPELVTIIDSDPKNIESDFSITNTQASEVILNDEQKKGKLNLRWIISQLPKFTNVLSALNLRWIISQLPKFTNVLSPLHKKSIVYQTIQRRGWNSIQKEQVRNRQYGNCNMCYTPQSEWKYDHIDGNKNNNDLDNCQGLCPECYSIKIERDSRLSIYQ